MCPRHTRTGSVTLRYTVALRYVTRVALRSVTCPRDERYRQSPDSVMRMDGTLQGFAYCDQPTSFTRGCLGWVKPLNTPLKPKLARFIERKSLVLIPNGRSNTFVHC